MDPAHAALPLALAAQMTDAAVARAAEVGAVVSAAVVDAGGHLMHFQRMDGAEIAGPTLAVDKAYTAVAHRVATAELGRLAAPGGELAGLASNGGGRYVVFGGGLPCWAGSEPGGLDGVVGGVVVGGVVVGGVGVSGGTVEQDISCAQVALAVFDATHDEQTP